MIDNAPPGKLFYVHVPSCGGTTFWSVLRSVYGKNSVDRIVQNEARQSEFAGSIDLEDTRDKAVLGGHVHYALAQIHCPDRRYVTLLRDPVARAVSVYYRKVRNQKWTQNMASGDRDLLDFWQHGAQRFQLRRYLSAEQHWASDSRSIDGEPNATADDIIDVLQTAFDVVGVTEQYHRSLFVLADCLDWPQVPTYDSHNIGGNKPRDIDADTRAELEGLLAQDCAVYRWACDRLNSRWTAMPHTVRERFSVYETRQHERTQQLLAAHHGQHPNTRNARVA